MARSRKTPQEVLKEFQKYSTRAQTNKTQWSREKNLKLAQKAYKQLAKQADSRLSELEKLSHEQFYKGVLSYSYADAKFDIEQRFDKYQRRSKKGKIIRNKQGDLPRFNRNMPTNIRGLTSKVNAMIDFMNKPTSTESRINEIYQKRVDTFNAHYGTKLSWQEYAEFWEGQEGHNMRTQSFYSRERMKAIAEISKHRGEEEKLKKMYIEGQKNNQTFRLVKDEVVNNVIKNILVDEGLTFEDLF